MADDLDDLLDEVENEYCSPGLGSKSQTQSQRGAHVPHSTQQCQHAFDSDKRRTASNSANAVQLGSAKADFVTKSLSSSNQCKGKKKACSELDDVIDDILSEGDKHDAAERNSKRKTSVGTSSTSNDRLVRTASKSSSSQQSKCFPVYLGGTLNAEGLGTTINKRSCSNLRCTDCDFQVSSFEDFQWISKTDYLFLRNNMPDFQRVSSHLARKKGSRAYACQCKWKSVKDVIDLQTQADVKWVCGKH